MTHVTPRPGARGPDAPGPAAPGSAAADRARGPAPAANGSGSPEDAAYTGRGERVRIWQPVAEAFAPGLAALAVFAGGLALLVSAAQPALPDRLHSLLAAWPVEMVDISHLMASVVGVLLLLVAGGLWRRLDGAYWLTLILLACGAVFSLLKALDWEEATFLALCAALLAPCRIAFFRQSRLTASLLTGQGLAGVLLALGAALWLMLVSYQNIPYRDELWWAVSGDGSGDGDVARSLRALAAAAVIGLMALVWTGLHPARARRTPGEAARLLDRAAAILGTAEGAHGEANLIFTGDKSFVFTRTGRSFVQYGVRGGHWIAMGDPVGPRSERVEALACFHAAADAASASPVIYAASLDVLPAVIDLGYTVRKIGEVAVVDVADFTLEGPARARLRQVRSRLTRDGWTVEVLEPGTVTDWDALRVVSDAWLDRQSGGEKAFSLGRFDPGYLARFPVAVASRRLDGSSSAPVAFASLWPSADRGELAVDLMRHGPDAPGGVMDLLFLAVIDWARSRGYRHLDLGMTPLAGLASVRYAPTLTRLGAAIYAVGERVYGFRGLRAYKAKFQPRWRPVFIAAPAQVSLPLALMDAALLTAGGLRGLLRSR